MHTEDSCRPNAPLGRPRPARLRRDPDRGAPGYPPLTRRLVAAIEDPNPVLYFEHKHLYRRIKGEVPDERYVADPKKGSRHNRGAALDLTLIDAEGRELPMPTPYDDFTQRAHRDSSDAPPDALENRRILEDAMVKRGFVPLPTEWWHFDAPDWKSYPLDDVPFDRIVR